MIQSKFRLFQSFWREKLTDPEQVSSVPELLERETDCDPEQFSSVPELLERETDCDPEQFSFVQSFRRETVFR